MSPALSAGACERPECCNLANDRAELLLARRRTRAAAGADMMLDPTRLYSGIYEDSWMGALNSRRSCLLGHIVALVRHEDGIGPVGKLKASVKAPMADRPALTRVPQTRTSLTSPGVTFVWLRPAESAFRYMTSRFSHVAHCPQHWQTQSRSSCTRLSSSLVIRRTVCWARSGPRCPSTISDRQRSTLKGPNNNNDRLYQL